MADLTKEDWREKLKQDDNAIVIDVRTNEEVALGTIGDPIHMDIYKPQQFLDGLEKLDKSRNYYVYCKAGGRSGQACTIMNQMGFANAYNLVGGYDKWDFQD